MSSFNFKFQFQASISSFNFKLQFQVSISCFNFKLQFQVLIHCYGQYSLCKFSNTYACKHSRTYIEMEQDHLKMSSEHPFSLKIHIKLISCKPLFQFYIALSCAGFVLDVFSCTSFVMDDAGCLFLCNLRNV